MLTDEARVRIIAGLLWVLVVLAALGGLSAWFRSAPAAKSVTDASTQAASAKGWAAAGFGSRFVAAYLASDKVTMGDLAIFLGSAPERTATRPPPDQAPRPVAAIGLRPIGDGYWAVTVAAGEPGLEQFWRVGVSERSGRLVATGLPTPVAIPPPAESPDLAVRFGDTPSAEDPTVQAVAGFLGAYTCGQGDVSRYVAPETDIAPVVPALCSEVAISRWGSAPDGENSTAVVVDAMLDPKDGGQPVSFALTLARRDGRWEVAELLPAPSLDTTADEEVVP